MIISMAWRRWAKNACLYATLVGVIMVPIATAEGILYPIESESRTTHLLDGVWDFRLADPADSAIGHREGWYKQQLRLTGGTIPMPVPSSYNDITEDKEVRDHVGVVWYDRTFYAPKSWSTDNLRVWLRFGGVHYAAQVFLNGGMVLSHSGGHVPFQIEVTSELKYGDKNLISVAVNNTLTDITVPQGQVNELATDNGTKIVQGYTFDFFNYAGIHRSVVLYTTPISYIDDIDVSTDINGDTGIITYKVTAGENPSGTPEASVSLVDRDGNYVIQDVAGLEGKLEVPQAKLWWPFLMDTDPAYLYTLEVRLTTDSGVSADVYRLPVGIRKVEWNNTAVTINGKPIYIRGFGRHEDSDIRGKGHDFPLIVRDYNLIKWLGANAYRTSHYPYSEEIMDFADKEGIMIIDECPGVNIGGYGFKDELLSAHKAALTTLYKRDKNRPSVIMWSVANEALTANTGADTYFSAVAEHIKSLDSSRPITMAMSASYSGDKAGEFMDVIGFNRYNSWYSNGGRTDTIIPNVMSEARDWFTKYNKPIIMTEYGADTMPGLHISPEYIWSEEYQVTVLSKHFEAFDNLMKEGFFIGEMIWNFADFNTAQTYTRVGGNKKGVFTRERQPKASAHLLRKRYWAVAQELDNATPPSDLDEYIISPKSKKSLRNEL
ncbi:beta-glucuronidase-like [Periplaneta americana]|uniref:beta-glucuronidase-like n=1 Tax=Periplaneta americana TaxID=6978 RepID=UPI0037E8C00E